MSVEAAFDWRDRQVSAAEAVSVVRPGDKVFVGSACATPRTLVGALEELMRPGVVLVHFLTNRVGTGDPPQTSYRHRVFYVGTDVRDLPESSRVEYLPLSLADVPRLFASGQLPLDVAMVQVAPPDADGTCSLGISVDVTKAAALAARDRDRGGQPRDASHLRREPDSGRSNRKLRAGGHPRGGVPPRARPAKWLSRSLATSPG